MQKALWIVALVVAGGAVNKYLLRSVWPGTIMPR
jgi:hypothetical protein